MKRFLSPPNQLTFFRILLTPVFVIMFLSQEASFRQWSVGVFVLAMLTDWYDGWVARRWGFITRWGTFLDPFADKVFISAAFFAFIALDLVPAWPVWIMVVRDIGITFLRSYSEIKGKPFDTSQLAKTKTFVQFVVIYYILLLQVAKTTLAADASWQPMVRQLLSSSIVDPLIIATALLTLATGLAYLLTNRATLRELYGSRS